MWRASWFSLRCLKTQRLIQNGANTAKRETPAMRTMSLTRGGISQKRSRAKMSANENRRPMRPARTASVILIRQRCFLKLSSCSRRESGSGARCCLSSDSDMVWGDYVCLVVNFLNLRDTFIFIRKRFI